MAISKTASALALALLFSSSVPTMAQSVKYDHLQRATISGHKIEISYALQANRDCTLDGYPAVKVTQIPLHGQVTVERGSAVPSYPAKNPRSRCNGRSLPAILVYYTPSAEFAGHDVVKMVSSFINGSVTETKIDIEVK